MNNELKIFENTTFGAVRAVEYEGRPWFVASDVARALGYENPANAVNTRCKKINKITQSPVGGERPKRPPVNLNIIPESGVYRLIMRSNLPDAERFQDWVKVTGKGQVYFVTKFLEEKADVQTA